MKVLIVGSILGALMGLILGGMHAQQQRRPAPTPPMTKAVAEAPLGPSCTIAYPRGFKITKRDLKAKPTCKPMDTAGILWDRCIRRVHV